MGFQSVAEDPIAVSPTITGNCTVTKDPAKKAGTPQTAKTGVSGRMVAICIAAISPLSKFVLTRNSEGVQIVDLWNIPTEYSCGLMGSQRNSIPTGVSGTCCGNDLTSPGALTVIKLTVIKSNAINSFFMDRVDIIGMWHPGCCCRVLFYGSGSDPSPNLVAPPDRQKIIEWAEDLSRCAWTEFCRDDVWASGGVHPHPSGGGYAPAKDMHDATPRAGVSHPRTPVEVFEPA